MASMFKIPILFVAVLAVCSARSIGRSLSGGEASSASLEYQGKVTAGGSPAPSGLVAAENQAAREARERATAEASRSSARFQAVKQDLNRRAMEAQRHTQSAAMHLAKANAAAERKVKAAAEEKSERSAARRDEDISKQIRAKSAQTLASAEKAADNIDKLVARLNKKAAEHEARARAAMARVAALSSSVGQEDEGNGSASRSNSGNNGGYGSGRNNRKVSDASASASSVSVN